jgi:osmotically-inducible protein OsmY
VLDAYVHGVTFVDDSGLNVERWARDEDLREKKYVVKSDREIEEAIKDAFVYDPRVSSFEVIPEVADGKATLRGTVDNFMARRAAAQDARNTVGVQWVDNRIKVRPTKPLSDRKVEGKIMSALDRDPYVESYEISADVTAGMAKLYGVVDSAFDKFHAEEVVSNVNGVIMVDNHLIVQKDSEPYLYKPYVDDSALHDYDWYESRPRFPSKSDIRIKADIENELFWSPFVDADDVTVIVNDGKVTLTGTVDSWSEYNAAVNNSYEGGAVYVDNDLTVE